MESLRQEGDDDHQTDRGEDDEEAELGIEQKLQDDRQPTQLGRDREHIDEGAGDQGDQTEANPIRIRITSKTGRPVTAATRPHISA